jgi:hypothetical protein
MIGQYLLNNNENATVPVLQKKIASKPGLGPTQGLGFWQEQERPKGRQWRAPCRLCTSVWHRWNGADNEGRLHALPDSQSPSFQSTVVKSWKA